MMKVALIRMPFLEQEYIKFSEKWEYIEDEYIGVGIVEAILHRYGYDVSLFDALSDTNLLKNLAHFILKPGIISILFFSISSIAYLAT